MHSQLSEVVMPLLHHDPRPRRAASRLAVVRLTGCVRLTHAAVAAGAAAWRPQQCGVAVLVPRRQAPEHSPSPHPTPDCCRFRWIGPRRPSADRSCWQRLPKLQVNQQSLW
jgi:hypothetical protein